MSRTATGRTGTRHTGGTGNVPDGREDAAQGKGAARPARCRARTRDGEVQGADRPNGCEVSDLHGCRATGAGRGKDWNGTRHRAREKRGVGAGKNLGNSFTISHP